MRKILIASHGNLAKGIAHTAELITGMQGCIDYICLYTDDKNPNQIIDDYFSQITPDMELIIFTDIVGGSVNQKMLAYTKIMNNIYLFAGANLPMVLSALLLPGEQLSRADIQEIIREARKGIQFMNDFTVNKMQQDELD